MLTCVVHALRIRVQGRNEKDNERFANSPSACNGMNVLSPVRCLTPPHFAEISQVAQIFNVFR